MQRRNSAFLNAEDCQNDQRGFPVNIFLPLSKAKLLSIQCQHIKDLIALISERSKVLKP